MPKMIINNIYGKENRGNFDDYDEDVYMMKYNEVVVSGNMQRGIKLGGS